MSNATQIPMQDVESSQIHSIGHDPETETLAIRFKDKATGGPSSLYHYTGFTEANFEALQNAESIGSHFYKHIRPHKERFPYECIEQAPAPAQADAE
ncbi:KTSC domain-containing protein [Paraburkholderia caribensis]|uniref:KTSC domain-containing protein n=1 Tax=Paraburkholderia caribensis TaxID=75105 RepID=UPI000D170F2E|nr:KTSC domain-containing protein [Paraburkholderia caribensis]PTB23481.1 KTSC domain-containing protein [Paraburkholderia caribensis]